MRCWCPPPQVSCLEAAGKICSLLANKKRDCKPFLSLRKRRENPPENPVVTEAVKALLEHSTHYDYRCVW